MAYISIDHQTALHNFKTICNHIPLNKWMLVLKDNAYGHGIELIADFAHHQGVRHVLVRSAGEALKVHHLFDSVLVIQDFPKKNVPQNIHYTLINENQIDTFPTRLNLHIKVNTGMNTGGIEPERLLPVYQKLLHKGFKIKGVFSHLHSAEEKNNSMHTQCKQFFSLKKDLLAYCHHQNICEVPSFHILNSAGAFRTQDFREHDFVRVGAAFYGYLSLPPNQKSHALRPIMSLWAEKITQFEIRKGEGLSYSKIYTSDCDQVVSTYDVGYADGFPRIPKEKRYITACNTPILGQVTMDYICASSSNEAICLFDNVWKIAAFFKVIPEEITCALSPNIPRRWTNQSNTTRSRRLSQDRQSVEKEIHALH